MRQFLISKRDGNHSRAIRLLVTALLISLVLVLTLPFVKSVSKNADEYVSGSHAYAAEETATEAKGEGETGEEVAYPPAPSLTAADYPSILGINSRIFIWLVAQLHLWFAAFVLAVPIFVFIIEIIGMATKDERYDKMGYELMKVSLTAYSITAILGGLLTISLLVFYPNFTVYLTRIFGSSFLIYALVFFAESASLYIYYYGWGAMKYGFLKWAHLSIGLILNGVGTTLMFLANGWVTFMMSPGGVDATGVFDGNVWHAMQNFLWNPINLHRFIANIAYGGSIVGAYAAYMFLSARIKEDKAHYDWMGYTANIIATAALMPLPFAGYWLTAEIYAYSQQMGITLMGGVFAWLFIVQAVLIGALFLSVNYYLWCGMGRSQGAYRYTKYIKYIAFVLMGCFIVWFTPHTLILENWELRALGGQYHPFLGPLGIMPAKNTAVNIMILFTFLSFLLYRRTNKTPTVSWASYGNAAQGALFVAAVANIVFLGVYYGYFTNTVYKVASSVPQVISTLVVLIGCMVIDVFMYKRAKDVGPLEWGKMPERSQYALFLLAVSFTWLMGLMGFIRSSIRQHWHVYSIMRDNSPDAFTVTIGYAAQIVTMGTILFMAIVIFIFWLSQLSAKKQAPEGV